MMNSVWTNPIATFILIGARTTEQSQRDVILCQGSIGEYTENFFIKKSRILECLIIATNCKYHQHAISRSSSHLQAAAVAAACSLRKQLTARAAASFNSINIAMAAEEGAAEAEAPSSSGMQQQQISSKPLPRSLQPQQVVGLVINTLGLRKKIHPSWRKTECGPD